MCTRLSLEKWSLEEGWILCRIDGLQCSTNCPEIKWAVHLVDYLENGELFWVLRVFTMRNHGSDTEKGIPDRTRTHFLLLRQLTAECLRGACGGQNACEIPNGCLCDFFENQDWKSEGSQTTVSDSALHLFGQGEMGSQGRRLTVHLDTNRSPVIGQINFASTPTSKVVK